MDLRKKLPRDPIILERRFVPRGAVIILEGQEDGNTAYLVQSGRVQAYVEQHDRKIIFAEMGPGEIFGEMALIFDGPRSASVEAIEDCNLIIINRHTLKKKLEEADSTISAIVHMLVRRIIDGNKNILNRRSAPDQLEELLLNMYDNVIETLPPEKKKRFKAFILPDLNNLLDSLKDFRNEMEADEMEKEGEDRS